MSTNKERGDRAYRYALLYAREVNDDEEIESAITDLMADLAHLADNDYGMYGTDALSLATEHFTEEQAEEAEEAVP